MVIDETTKVIFLHNPKCGGTFFRQAYFLNYHNRIPSIYWKLYEQEINVDLGHINLHNLPRFIPDYKDYRIVVFVRNPFNRFVTAFKTASSHRKNIYEIGHKCSWDTDEICKYILSLNYFQQDVILRNPDTPWLNPQSNYINDSTIIFRFESYTDWQVLLNIFKITNVSVNIKEDYNVSDQAKRMIRQLYFDDDAIFRMYE